jgi:error-prone DNA polymerase
MLLSMIYTNVYNSSSVQTKTAAFMPDPTSPKRQVCSSRARATTRRQRARADAFSYAELHCRTNFSFLEGASHPDELVQRATAWGYGALAITDRNSLAGVVRAHVAAKEAGLKLLIGAEITPHDAPPVVLLATNREAYSRLAHLITRGCRRAEKGECSLTFDDLAEHADGLLACVVLNRWQHPWQHGENNHKPPAVVTRDAPSVLTADALTEKLLSRAHLTLARYRELFANRCYALCELHRGPHDRLLLARSIAAAKRAGVPLVAANDVHYHEPQRRMLQDVLSAIRAGTTVTELNGGLFSNAERYLKSPDQMAELFADYPQALARTIEIAQRCCFSLDELRYEYPVELCPPGTTPLEHLTQLTWSGSRQRYPQGLPEKVRRLIEHELLLIEQLHYETYFLTVWDLVRFARSRGILCQGRGSAANSVVCYCLGVTSVDPERIDVLFERFVSRERNEAPDIDVDFEHERREEVLQYIYEKYGRERAGMTAEVITYRPRSAVRDVGKALGLSPDRVDVLAKALENYQEEEKLARRFREAGLNPTSAVARQVMRLVREIIGFPRHLSQHVGGMVITQGPLCGLVPIENAAMPGRTVIQWDKDDLDALGILKVDCLSLGMLTAIHKGFDLIEAHYGPKLTLSTVPTEDPAVYEMIQQADTMGVFQIESRAQMSMLPRLKPQCFYDLVIEVAIVRPGPIQGNMVHPYLRRRRGDEPVEFPDERIKTVLEKTLGVPIFQEQAMRLAVVAAGFTPGEADQLRRAMGAWRRTGVIDRFRSKLIGGMQQNGYSAAFGERLFNQIRGFGEYGFPESHAASFALLVYVSAWLKRYCPEIFAAALLNSQPMGFYAPAQLVADARKHGVEVRPIDVNFSSWDCSLEEASLGEESSGDTVNSSPPALFTGERPSREIHPSPKSSPQEEKSFLAGGRYALRLGLRMISGLSRAQADQIVQCRGEKPFASFGELVRRSSLSSAVLTRLSKADAFGSLNLCRREALWRSLPEQKIAPLFVAADAEEPEVKLPQMSPLAEVVADYRSSGLSLRDHPVKFLRPLLERLQAVQARELALLPIGGRLKVAGLVLLRQRPSTASGITFVTLEDETGFANLIVKPDVWERYHHVARTAKTMLAHGHLERQGKVIHLLVDKLEDLSSLLGHVESHSRDFR